MIHSNCMKNTISILDKTFTNLRTVTVSIIRDFSRVHPVFKKYYKDVTDEQITNIEDFLISNRDVDFLENIYSLFDELLSPCYEELKKYSGYENCDEDDDSWEDFLYQGLCSDFMSRFPESD